MPSFIVEIEILSLPFAIIGGCSRCVTTVGFGMVPAILEELEEDVVLVGARREPEGEQESESE